MSAPSKEISGGTPESEPLRIPLLGLGTWQAQGNSAYQAVRMALDIGYRHVDTATMYGNEKQVGDALRDSGLARSDVWITTKLPPARVGNERRTVEESLQLLGIDQIDLWLIHWPPSARELTSCWERLIELREAGLVRAIGVSNYSVAQLDELIAATGVAPAVNQIPWDVQRHDPALLSAHDERGVVLEGYSPFRHTNMSAAPLAEAAAAHGRSAEQVVLRWHLQHGIVAIPKSTHRERIAMNFDVFDFELSAEEMDSIDALGQPGGRRRRWRR